jgi:hypothetical protein
MDEEDRLPGVGVVERAPRSVAAQRRRAARERPGVLVAPDRELRGLALGWACAGALAIVAAVAFGSLAELSPLETSAMIGALFFPPVVSVARAMLGRRTPTRIRYRIILERAGAPPDGLAAEPRARTTVRAALVAVLISVAMLPFVAASLAFAEAAMGRAPDQLTDHLPEEAALVAGEWTLVCAVVALVILRWIHAWERDRSRTALCPPLHSGRLGAVYFADGASGSRRAGDPVASRSRRR